MLEPVSADATLHNITVSLSAAQAARAIMAEKQLEGYGLRIYVAGSGCSGVRFGMSLDKDLRQSDLSFEAHGVRIIIDEVSIDYLRGAKVDFLDDPQHGAGFLVDSPVAKAYQHGEGGCSCDGSCDCSSC